MPSLFVIEHALGDLFETRQELIDQVAFTDEQIQNKQAALDAVDGAIVEYVTKEVRKVDNIARLLVEWKARRSAIEVERGRLQSFADQIERNEARLKETVLQVMRDCDVKKLEGNFGMLKRQANGGVQAVEVAQENLVPEGLKRYTLTMRGDLYHWLWSVVTEWEKERPAHPLAHRVFDEAKSEPDISAIRAELERGEGVPGCVLKERGEHLRCS